MSVSKDNCTELPVLLEEWPYAYVVNDAYVNSRCHWCLKGTKDPAKAFLSCPRCNFALYCDSDCQKAALKDHGEECLHMEKLEGEAIPCDTVRLIARIIFKNEELKYKETLPSSAQTRHFKDLMSHEEEIRRDDSSSGYFMTFNHICLELKQYLLDDKYYQNNDDFLLEIFGKVAINSHGSGVSKGVYIKASIMDHSCDPDAMFCFDGPKLLIRALKTNLENRPLSEVTICYFDPFKSTSERQIIAWKNYYFPTRCNCTACQDKTRDGEMCSILCQHCSGTVILPDAMREQLGLAHELMHSVNGVIATCQTCNRATNTEEAMMLMQAIGCFLALQDTEACLVFNQSIELMPVDKRNEWQAIFNYVFDSELFDFEALTNELIERASKLLTDFNVFSSRLSTEVVRLVRIARRSKEEAITHCQRALKGHMRFGLPWCETRLFLMLFLGGFYCSNIPSKLEEGIRLLEEAEKCCLLIGDQQRAKICHNTIVNVRDAMKK